MWNLLVEVGRWLWNGVRPSDNAQAYLADLGRNTYIYCPMIAVGFMLIGLHTGWVGGYVIAAIFSIIPVVLMDVIRRLAADVPQAGNTAGKWINTAATPHTWLAILNFWFIVLQPSSQYRTLAYLAILATALFIMVSGRWGHEPKWYRPLTRISLFLPALIAVGTLAMDAFWPEELVAWKTSLGINRAQATKDHFGPRFDQNVVVVWELGTAYPLDSQGRLQTGRLIHPRTILWKTEDEVVVLNSMRFGTYLERANNGAREPDARRRVLFPESLVRSTSLSDEGNRMVSIPMGTWFYVDANGDGQPEPDPYKNNQSDMAVQVTTARTFLAGQVIVLCLRQDYPSYPDYPVCLEQTTLARLPNL